MSSRSSLMFLSLLAGASIAPLAPAFSATEPIGNAVGVVQVVTAELAHETRTLTIGDDVRLNEAIAVSDDGSGTFKLLDDTRLALGPGARLVLDTFVYDPAKTGNAVAMRFVKGAFRFITGLAEKPAYVIRVPSASITVRGTTFDVFVEDSGTSWLLLHEGAVRICNTAGTCRDHDEPGKLVRIADDGTLSHPTRWTSMPRTERISFDEGFPFIADPPSFEHVPMDPAPTHTEEASLSPASDTAEMPPLRKKPKVKDAQKAKDKVRAAAASAEEPAAKRLPKKARAKAKAPARNKIDAATSRDPGKPGRASHKPDRATQERERGLDAAATYAPKAVERLRKRRTIERAETSRGKAAAGWRKYVDTYVNRR